MRLRRLPTEMEAVQWSGSNTEEMIEFLGEFKIDAGRGGALLFQAGVNGAQEWVPAPIGHWIMRDPNFPIRDFWPVDNDYVARNFERIQETA